MKSTRDALIDAATTLLDKGGPDAVTLREVGRMVGVSHNAPYRHFADKRALLAAVAAREVRTAAEQYRKVVADGVSVQSAMRHYVRRALAHPERFQLIYSDLLRQDEELVRVSAEARSAVSSAVAAGQERGELPQGDPVKLGWLLAACAYGATIRALAEPQFRNTRESVQAETLIEELFRYLGKSGDSPAA